MTAKTSERVFQWPLQKVILQDYSVRLVPVDYSHLDQLSVWSAEEDIWRYMTFAYLASKNDLEDWIGAAMDANKRGIEMNFAIIDEVSQSAVGTTSFYRIVPEHKRLELDKTWLGTPYRRTRINTAAKYLMLNYAFETISANRVELNTDARNVRSQRAIERLGAVRDGFLRCHTIMRDGFVRDTVNYSFVMRDWPATKSQILDLLQNRR
jgi:RimJ/RimL family protein N-acetyltransferase